MCYRVIDNCTRFCCLLTAFKMRCLFPEASRPCPSFLLLCCLLLSLPLLAAVSPAVGPTLRVVSRSSSRLDAQRLQALPWTLCTFPVLWLHPRLQDKG